jgi:hypothetical protein
MPRLLLIASIAILLDFSARSAWARDLFQDLGLRSNTDQVPDGTPNVGAIYTPTGKPAWSPDLANPDPVNPRRVQSGPPLRVGGDEVGICSTSESTLAFVLGDPAAQVKLHPHQIKGVPVTTGGAVRAQIKAAGSAISDYDLSGTVYAIVFSSGSWAFAKY